MRFVSVIMAAGYGIEMVAMALIVPAILYMVMSQRLLQTFMKFSGVELWYAVYQPIKTGLLIIGIFLIARGSNRW
jgi:hypothetical protein